MRPSTEVHDALACLLEYPRDGDIDRHRVAVALVGAECPETSTELAPFLAFLEASDMGQVEERFTRSFDNTAERALEVGWHVFGENYTRGTFMVRMRQRLREVGVEENGELPDHLSHLLPLLARLDSADAGALAHDSVAPAVEKILAALRSDENPWAGVLAAVRHVVSLHEAPERPPVGEHIPTTWPPPPPTHTEACDE